MEKLKIKIQKELQKTGFPTEIKVNTILLEKKWNVHPNDPYSDPQTQTIRTIDFRAELIKRGKNKISASCQLFIECKKGVSSWIFYVDKNFINMAYQLGFKSGKLSKKKKNVSGLDKVTDYHTLIKPNISYNYQVVFKEDNFYGAQMQVLNGIDSSSSTDRYKKHLLFPLIIYEGNMFECKYDKEMILEKTDYIRYLTGGIPSNLLPTFIDVITLDFLPQYLDIVKQEFINLTTS